MSRLPNLGALRLLGPIVPTGARERPPGRDPNAPVDPMLQRTYGEPNSSDDENLDPDADENNDPFDDADSSPSSEKSPPAKKSKTTPTPTPNPDPNAGQPEPPQLSGGAAPVVPTAPNPSQSQKRPGGGSESPPKKAREYENDQNAFIEGINKKLEQMVQDSGEGVEVKDGVKYWHPNVNKETGEVEPPKPSGDCCTKR